jgi:hypothetical protein
LSSQTELLAGQTSDPEFQQIVAKVQSAAPPPPAPSGPMPR